MLSAKQILFLNELPGVGAASIRALNDYLVSQRLFFPEKENEIIGLLSEAKENSVRFKRVPDAKEISNAKAQSDEILEKSASNDIRIISCYDLNFPPLLKGIKNEPLLLHCRGNMGSLGKPTVAIIGTREPSKHAESAGPRLTSYFAKADFTIVSGLALGCDTIGHKTAVESNTPTVAVMAGGLHSYYPKENKQLASEILEKEGLLISELPYGTNPHRSTFVDRDRLQSGLSLGVVVLETGIKGGTLHTVGFALKEERPVACMYSHIKSKDGSDQHEKFQGNKMLVEQNQAVPLDSPEAIEAYILLLLSKAGTKDDNPGVLSNNLDLSQSSPLSLNTKQLDLFS